MSLTNYLHFLTIKNQHVFERGQLTKNTPYMTCYFQFMELKQQKNEEGRCLDQ
jgi:hypothetical protein